jgi:hypothetical protein
MMTRMNYQIVLSLSLLLCVSALTAAQSQYSLPACGANAKDMLGGRLKLKVDKDALVKKGRDVDYSNYAVGFGKKKERAWLQGIYGPNATSGQVPREWLRASSEVTQRTWKFGDFEGVDAKGKLADGNYWRYFGTLGESLYYYEAPPDAAAYFDRIIDGLCFRDAD